MINTTSQIKKVSVHRRGIALVTVLSLMVVIFSIVTVASLVALNNRRSSSDNLVTSQAQYAAEAGIEQAIFQAFYFPYDNWNASTDSVGSLNGRAFQFDTCAYRKWLTGIYLVTQNRAGNNNQTCQYGGNGTATVATPGVAGLLNNTTVTLPTATLLSSGGSTVDYTITLARADDNLTNRTVITMTSVGRVMAGTGVNAREIATRTLTRVSEISTAPFEGDRFAVLTNAVNCSLCHLHVDNMRRAYAPVTSTEQFDRVRMAVLNEDVNLDPAHNGDTFIAGTLYARQDVTNTGANEVYAPTWYVNPGRVQAGSANSIRGLPFGQSDTGNPLRDATLVDADTATGATTRNAKVYKNYPILSDIGTGNFTGGWPDGSVPDNFPTIVPDPNNDTLVSDQEWGNYIASSPTGTLTVPAGSSGRIFGVRRPRSTATVSSTAPIAYDPTRFNATASNTATCDAAYRETQIRSLTAAYRTPNVTNQATAIGNLRTNCRAWLIQEALSTPNNRDFEPGTDQAQLAVTGTNAQVIATATQADGRTRNNFWVRYDAPNQRMQLLFRTSSNTTATNTCGDDPTSSLTTYSIGSNCGMISFSLTEADIFPSNSNAAATTLAVASTNTWDGNLIIDAGRINNSNRMVDLSGTININGDLVIRGQIRGTGRIVARGNIYIVGDFVYGCGISACPITGAVSYQNPTQLPMIALLAGGAISVGDFDFPDYRASNGGQDYGGGVFDLANDQVGRETSDSGPPVGWQYYNIPGSTGTNSTRGNCAGDMGFVPMTASNVNERNKDLASTVTNKRYFQSMPFGLLVARGGFCSYENGGTQLNDANTATVIPIYPSNGPIRVGGNLTSGFYDEPGTAPELAAGLGCTLGATALSQFRNTRLGAAADIGLNTGFWCPPNAGTGFLRTWNTGGNTNPGSDTSAWVAQSSQNQGLDGSRGMTTGWLAGVTGFNGTRYTRLGDISQTRLLKLMWLSTMEVGRDVNTADVALTPGPLRTDGIFYSAHAIFTLARSFQNRFTWGGTVRSQIEGRWVHNGSAVSAELGFLVTGDYTGGVDAQFTNNNTSTINFNPSPASPGNAGPAMGIFFDERLIGLLQLQNGNQVRLRRTGTFAPGTR